MSDILDRMQKCQYPELTSCGDGVTVADVIREIASFRVELQTRTGLDYQVARWLSAPPHEVSIASALGQRDRALARVKELEGLLQTLLNYTIACEGMLNCTESWQCSKVRTALGITKEVGDE